MSIKHPLRKLSNENWERCGKMRYRIEQLFGSIKQKIGSSFKLLKEDLARKASIACAILWNFWVLTTYLFLLFLSDILHIAKLKGYDRFLGQSLKRYCNICCGIIQKGLIIVYNKKSPIAYFCDIINSNKSEFSQTGMTYTFPFTNKL